MLVKVIFSKTLKSHLKPLGLIHRIIVSSLPNQPKNICFQTLQLFLECILSSRLRFRLYYSASLHVIFWKSIFMSFKRIFQFLAQFCCWISVSSVSGFGGTFFFVPGGCAGDLQRMRLKGLQYSRGWVHFPSSGRSDRRLLTWFVSTHYNFGCLTFAGSRRVWCLAVAIACCLSSLLHLSFQTGDLGGAVSLLLGVNHDSHTFFCYNKILEGFFIPSLRLVPNGRNSFR